MHIAGVWPANTRVGQEIVMILLERGESQKSVAEQNIDKGCPASVDSVHQLFNDAMYT